MATFYLINTIQLATVNYLAGSLLDSAVDPTTQIAAQGGVLVASSDATVAAAAALAQSARKVGVSGCTLNAIMLAGYEKSIAAAQAVDAAEIAARSSIGAALTNADATIQVAAGRNRTLPAIPLTANRTLTIGTTGAVTGDTITITRLDTAAYTYAIVNGGAGAGTIYTMPVSKVSFCTVAFDGTNWVLRSVGLGS